MEKSGTNLISKKFQIKGGYPLIIEELQKRNWSQTNDFESDDFDFRFTSIIKDSKFESLKFHQICNHFPKITELNLKSSLCKNSKLCAWRNPGSRDDLFPRTFCIPEEHKIKDFIALFEHIEVLLAAKK